MDYRILTRNDRQRWDVFVEESPQGSIYATTRYLDAIGCPYELAVVEDGDSILGGFVLSRNEVRLRANPLFVKYLGVLHAAALEGRVAQQYEVDSTFAERMASGGVWIYAFHPNYENWINFYWKGFSQTTHYTYQIDFRSTPEFRASYRKGTRWAVNKARKEELRVADVDTETFVRVNLATYAARGTRAPYSAKRLTGLLEKLQRAGCLYARAVVDGLGNTHAVGAVAYDRRSANLILNGSDPSLRKMSGNSLLLDHLIEFAALRCEIFDFEGSMHQRIEKFYRGFGGQLTGYSVIARKNVMTSAYRAALALAKRLNG